MTSRCAFYNDEKRFNRGGVQAASSFQPFHKTLGAFDRQSDIGIILSIRNPAHVTADLALQYLWKLEIFNFPHGAGHFIPLHCLFAPGAIADFHRAENLFDARLEQICASQSVTPIQLT